MSRHLCEHKGCIHVEDEVDCIVCDQPITTKTRIHTFVPRTRPHIHLGELGDERSIAYGWGPADLNGEHFV